MWYHWPVIIQYRSVGKVLDSTSLDCHMTKPVRNQYRSHDGWTRWILWTAGFDHARARACSCALTNRPTKRRWKLARRIQSTCTGRLQISSTCTQFQFCRGKCPAVNMWISHTKFVCGFHIQNCKKKVQFPDPVQLTRCPQWTFLLVTFFCLSMGCDDAIPVLGCCRITM